MHRLKPIILILAIFVAGCATQNVKIAWQVESSHFVTRGAYARIKKVDNRHALAYGSGSSVCIRFSEDGCESWSEPTEVARAEGYNYTNSELVQLQSGKLLFTWNARPQKER